MTKKNEQENRAITQQAKRLARLEAEKSMAEEKLQELLERRVTGYRSQIETIHKRITSKQAMIDKLNDEIAELVAKAGDLEAKIVMVLGDNPTIEEDA